MFKQKFWLRFTILLVLLVFVCSKSFADTQYQAQIKYPDYACGYTGKDNWENFNRKVFIFNLKANKYILKPINIVWASIMPQYGMDRIQSFYNNLNYPVRLVGSLLQKDFPSVKTESQRFLINTTLGGLGFYDVANSRYKIEAHDENIEQVLAYRNVKQGNYLVLPVVTQGSARDITGQILDLPLSPTSYLFIVGPFSAISAGVSVLNDTTKMQPIFKMTSNYADPYEVSKLSDGLSHYVKNINLDRDLVFAHAAKNPQTLNISNNSVQDNTDLASDITLNNYFPQTPLIDSMRTLLFDNQKIDTSKWSELSVWNKTFDKRLKTASARVNYGRPKYNYRYILQEKKGAPLAIIYPSIGEGLMSKESVMQAKMLYDQGYSVIVLGSAFQWEFVRSMPEDYRPGMPYQDALYLRKLTQSVLIDLEVRKSCRFGKKIIVGDSFGGLTALFVAAEEEKQNTLGISKYLTINPPIELFYALQQLDNCAQGLNNTENLKFKTALMSEKLSRITKKVENNQENKTIEAMPFTEEEAKIAVSFSARQKLSDVVFTIENRPTSKKSDFYDEFDNMSFYDYAQKYLVSVQNKPIEQLKNETSLYSIEDFLKTSDNYKIYLTKDDFFVNKQQLAWLKSVTGSKSLLFSNGSHLGFLYRPEFSEHFIEDLKQN